MGFLQSAVVGIVLAIGSLLTISFGLFHVQPNVTNSVAKPAPTHASSTSTPQTPPTKNSSKSDVGGPSAANLSSKASSSVSVNATLASPDPQIRQQCQANSTIWICPIVSEVDPDSFAFLNGADGSLSNFAKDKKHVYTLYMDGPSVLPEADPASFQVITSYPWWWVKDANHVWWDLQLEDSADPSTFVVLPYGQYAKDDKHVYSADLAIPGADPASFSFYSDGVYAHDDAQVYSEGSNVPDANPSTFIDIGNGYGKDNQHVWYDGTIIIGADPTTFELVNGSSQIDAGPAVRLRSCQRRWMSWSMLSKVRMVKVGLFELQWPILLQHGTPPGLRGI